MELVIDIGSNNIKFVEGQYVRQKVKVNRRTVRENTDHIIGIELDENAKKIGDQIKMVLEKYKFTSKKCIIVLRTQNAIFKELVLPDAKRKVLVKMAYNQLAPSVPNINSYYLDYVVLERFVEENSKKVKLAIYAVPKEMVEGYYKMIKDIGLTPSRIDVQKNCLEKLFMNKFNINGNEVTNVTLIGDLGSSTISLDLIVEGQAVFHREVNYKRALDRYLEADEETERRANRDALCQIVSEEIYKIMQFSMSQAVRQSVTRVYFYGVKRGVENICDFISDELGIEAELISSVSSIENAGQIADVLVPASALIKRK